jgi:hypothetical protein
MLGSSAWGDEHRREEPQEVRRACTGSLLSPRSHRPASCLHCVGGLLYVDALLLLTRRPPEAPALLCPSTAPAGRPRAPEGRGWKVGGRAASGAGGATIFDSLPIERLQSAGFPGASSWNPFWETVWYIFGSRRPRSWS